MLELHPEFLKKNGRPEFVVLPYEEFVQLQECLEEAEDLLELRRARAENAGEPGISLADAKRQLGIGD